MKVQIIDAMKVVRVEGRMQMIEKKSKIWNRREEDNTIIGVIIYFI